MGRTMSPNTLNKLQQNQTTTRLIPVPDWNKYHSWPPIGGLRHLIFHEKTNGFASAFKRVGRRVLVDEKEFFRVVDEKNGGGSE